MIHITIDIYGKKKKNTQFIQSHVTKDTFAKMSRGVGADLITRAYDDARFPCGDSILAAILMTSESWRDEL